MHVWKRKDKYFSIYKKKKKVIIYLEGKKPSIESIEKENGKKYTSLLQKTCENSNTIEDDVNNGVHALEGTF